MCVLGFPRRIYPAVNFHLARRIWVADGMLHRLLATILVAGLLVSTWALTF